MTHPCQDLEPGPSTELAALAGRYCRLIDRCADGQDQWLGEIAELLPRLHAGICSVEAVGRYLDLLDPVDLDARFELFSRLRKLLDDRDPYWLEFDRVADGAEAMSGSLADDLTDIYCELKQGLRLFELDPEYALLTLAVGYERHWGQHLIDAERHLAMLGAQSRIEP